MKKHLLTFALLSIALTTNAQWTQTNGPEGGFITAFVTNGTNLFAGTHGGGVFINTTILTGVSEAKKNNLQISIYPTPIPKEENVFTISIGTLLNNTHVEIYDLLGKIIYSENIDNTTSKEIQLKNISSGIYLVNVSDGTKLYSQKLIVE